MKNYIYEGTITHSRTAPKMHKFIYKACYFYFDLNKTSELNTLEPLVSFNAKNYLSATEILKNIDYKFGDHCSPDIKRVFALTQLSYLGFCFNPVSFYYCFGDNDKLLYVVSQITNTPWGEKNINCFDYQTTDGKNKFPKNFHVSPFMPMEIEYDWEFNIPGKVIDVIMSNTLHDEKSPFFFAHLKLKAKELNQKNILINFIIYPLMSFKTIAGIYWQALILYLKQVPFYTHPNKRESV